MWINFKESLSSTRNGSAPSKYYSIENPNGNITRQHYRHSPNPRPSTPSLLFLPTSSAWCQPPQLRHFKYHFIVIKSHQTIWRLSPFKPFRAPPPSIYIYYVPRAYQSINLIEFIYDEKLLKCLVMKTQKVINLLRLNCSAGGRKTSMAVLRYDSRIPKRGGAQLTNSKSPNPAQLRTCSYTAHTYMHTYDLFTVEWNGPRATAGHAGRELVIASMRW